MMNEKTQTQINNFNEFLIALNAVVKKINENPELEKHLTTVEGDSVRWLQAGNISCGHINATQDFIDLMTELLCLLETNLISSEGQHSEYYYKLKKTDYHLRVGEYDCFGPLSSVLTIPSREWRVCYG